MKNYLLNVLIVTMSIFLSSDAYCLSFSDLINNAPGMDQNLQNPPLIFDKDFDWQHNPINIPINYQITSAQLIIYANDVDTVTQQPSIVPEVDEIYAYDSGVRRYLGPLIGGNDTWDYTTFNLGSNFFDDIKNGLRVEINVDALSDFNNWGVTIGSSELRGNYAPVPLPGTLVMLGSGILILVGVGRCSQRHLRNPTSTKG